MKFPISKLDRQKYYDDVFNLLDDKECQIFIDTNIIALLFRIHDSARQEFFDWISLLFSDKRINTPLWSVNEYTNRFIRNKIDDYFSPIKKVSTINKDFQEINSFLKMNADTSSIIGTSFTTLKELHDDLELIENKLKSIAAIAKSKDEKYKLKVHDEIQSLFENTTVKSDINDILLRVKNLGGIRFNHKLPPGFQDEKKDLNSFGDLIIWYEILDFCKLHSSKKVILITNDMKSDWVYAPNRIIDNSREIPNKEPQLKIADPRLVYEFSQITNSEDFYIINFDNLTQILLSNFKGKFSQLANALQIIYKQTSDNEVNDSESSGDVKETFILESTNEESSTETTAEPSKTVPEEILSDEFEYSSDSLADRDFPMFEESFLIETIQNLKTHNWYVQNPAIEKLFNWNINSISQNSLNANTLFVLGRNIYQTACGGSVSALDFIGNMRAKLQKLNDFVANHLYSGILYEIYFDSQNLFRQDQFKSNYIDQVMNIKDVARLKPSIEFIRKKLKPYEKCLFYFPSVKTSQLLELIITIDSTRNERDDWQGQKIYFWNVNNLTLNGIELLTDYGNNSLMLYYLQMNKEDLINIISSNYAIPQNQMSVKTSLVLPKNEYYSFGMKALKKLSIALNCD